MSNLRKNKDQSNTIQKPFVSAIFLVKFDVHSGYKIQWSSISSIYNKDDGISQLKNIEYKCLPSGLHNVPSDLIFFIQPNDIAVDEENDPFKNILYGLSVFMQNFDAIKTSRNDVKMYSLGILVDPEINLNLSNGLNIFPKNFISKYLPTWRPVNYTSGWEHIDELKNCLLKFMESGQQNDYSIFQEFFDKYRVRNDHHSHCNHAKKLSLNSFDSISNQTIETNTSIENSSFLTAAASPVHTDHMLLKLPALIDQLGPLVFPIWKAALLRKRIIISNTQTIEQACAFTYLISILSTIPQEIIPIITSTSKSTSATSDILSDIASQLSSSSSTANNSSAIGRGRKSKKREKGIKIHQYIQPLYNVGVNDIDWLNQLHRDYTNKHETKCPGFVACTRDEILLYKTDLYDYCVKIGNDVDGVLPKFVRSESMDPGEREHKQLATFKDLSVLQQMTHECDDLALPKLWWLEVSERISWSKYAIDGFFWWASAGENIKIQEEIFKNLFKSNVKFSKIPNDLNNVLNVIGFFQNLTVKIFQSLADIISNEESGVKRYNNFTDNGGEDEEEDEEEEDEEEDHDGFEQEDDIYINWNDIEEMGLDSYNQNDCDFVVSLAKLYFDKDIKIGSRMGVFC